MNYYLKQFLTIYRVIPIKGLYHIYEEAKMNHDGSKREPCLLCGGATQPISDMIGHIREMHATTHGTAEIIAELMIRVNNLETLVKGK